MVSLPVSAPITPRPQTGFHGINRFGIGGCCCGPKESPSPSLSAIASYGSYYAAPKDVCDCCGNDQTIRVARATIVGPNDTCRPQAFNFACQSFANYSVADGQTLILDKCRRDEEERCAGPFTEFGVTFYRSTVRWYGCQNIQITQTFFNPGWPACNNAGTFNVNMSMRVGVTCQSIIKQDSSGQKFLDQLIYRAYLNFEFVSYPQPLPANLQFCGFLNSLPCSNPSPCGADFPGAPSRTCSPASDPSCICGPFTLKVMQHDNFPGIQEWFLTVT